MALAVYSRIGSMLRAAGVDLDDLPDLIATRYGLIVDRRALAALAQDGPVRRPDIELLEAVALILQVRVDDLLDVHAAAPPGAGSIVPGGILLDPERDARLRDLAELRDHGEHPLSDAEARELETLIAEAGRALVERDIAATAQHLGVPIEAARERITAQATDADRFWSALAASPERMAAEVQAAKARRRAQAR